MKKRMFYMVILLMLCFPICFSSWVGGGIDIVKSNLNISDQEVSITIHNQKNSDKIVTTTKYYTPVKNSIVVTHNLSRTNENGVAENEKWGEVGGDYTTTDYDEIPLYYDVNDGVYTKVTRHDANKGPEQIKSLKIEVGTWQEVSDDSTWANVWDVGYDSNTLFYFYTNCENNWSFNQKYSKGDVIPNSEKVISENEEIDDVTGSIVKTTTYQRVLVRDVKKQERGKYRMLGVGLSALKYIYGYYYPTYEQRKVVTTQTREPSENSVSSSVLKIKKGSRITPIDLQIDNYGLCGIYSDSEYSQLFDFKKPINSNTNLYLRYVENSFIDNLTKTINNNTSTLNVYDQSSGSAGNYDVFGDPTYNKSDRSCFIGNSNVSLGSTVNLTYSNGLIYEKPITGTISDSLGKHRTSTDSSISEQYNGTNDIGESDCSFKLILCGDLYVKGTLNVGAHIGGYSSGYSKYSYIIGKYSSIDLYGHNIYVDGGTLNAYGLIKDSVGTGKIVVNNGGSITGTVTVSDGRDINQAMIGISKRQSPFTEYRFSYLQTTIQVMNGSTMKAYLKLELGRYGVTNLLFNLFSTSKALFIWNDSISSSYILYEFYQINSITDKTLLRDYYNSRNRFTLNANIKENCSLELKFSITFSSLASIEAKVDFGRIDCPISPFFDLVVKSGFNFVIESKMTFYPGSKLYSEEGSIISFKFYGTKKYGDIGALSVTIPGESRYLAGGIMAYSNRISDLSSYGASENIFTNGIYNSNYYWKYTKVSDITILGDITFDNSINTSVSTNDGYYLLSGEINLSPNSLKTILTNKNCIKTYDIKSELTRGFLFSSNKSKVDYQYEYATSYNLNCLYSFNKSYIIDKNVAIVGKYDLESGIYSSENNITLENNEIVLSDNNNKYMLYTDTDMYEGGSAKSNQKDRIDRNIEIREITIVNSDWRIIKNNNVNYLFYKGILIPIKTTLSNDFTISNGTILDVNAQKFHSNKDSDVKNAGFYQNIKVEYDSINKRWKFKSFE